MVKNRIISKKKKRLYLLTFPHKDFATFARVSLIDFPLYFTNMISRGSLLMFHSPSDLSQSLDSE